MMKEILQDMIRQKMRNQENIIREAFEKHFGFPLEPVLKTETEKFERRIIEGDPMEAYTYNGETFLYISREPELSNEGERITITHYYQMV